MRNSFYHVGYFSCDRYEYNMVGKLFNTITLLLYKKITIKNTGKPCHPLRDCHLLIKTVQYLNIAELVFDASFFSTKIWPISGYFFPNSVVHSLSFLLHASVISRLCKVVPCHIRGQSLFLALAALV